jgi:hypothetical protein
MERIMKSILLYNTISNHLNGCQDIVKIILNFLEKNVEDFGNIDDGKTVKKIFGENGYDYYRSWEKFIKAEEYYNYGGGDVTSPRPVHFYCEINSTFIKHFSSVDSGDSINNSKESQDQNQSRDNLSLLFIWTTNSRPVCNLIKINEKDDEEAKSIVRFLKDRNSFTPEIDLTF